MLNSRTPPTSLNGLFKLKLLPYPEWSCNWNKHYYDAWWNVPVWNKLKVVWSPRRESWSAMIPYASIHIMTQRKKNGYKRCIACDQLITLLACHEAPASHGYLLAKLRILSRFNYECNWLLKSYIAIGKWFHLSEHSTITDINDSLLP